MLLELMRLEVAVAVLEAVLKAQAALVVEALLVIPQLLAQQTLAVVEEAYHLLLH
jgi:hypothetical protein